MLYLTGDSTARQTVAALEREGWGRMVVKHRIRPYPGEPWALDNGAYGAWKAERDWPEAQFRRFLTWAEGEAAAGRSPLFGVVPDIVAAGQASLAWSVAWRAQLRDAFPWLLAVQDGMEPAAVARALPAFDGVFLGGTLRFKRDEGRRYRDLAGERGGWFHYGRASRYWLLEHARELGADSADSTGPLYSVAEFRRHAGNLVRSGVQGRLSL